MQENGIISVIKHFPGHGDTYTDTHNTETFVNHDMARLESCELVPFKSAIENGVDFVMVSHIKVPNVDDSGLPSSLSKSIVTVRYAETDKMGIVHHSVYPIWFELARTDLSEQAG